jgi:predicted tellurium resistance membrane protein TerC
MEILTLFTEPTTWLALVTLVLLEIVLGIDNLVFIAILSNKLPPEQQTRARRLGLGLALILRIGLLLLIGWIVTLQTPLFDLGLAGSPGPHGEPTFETAFSGRDLILLAGGLFLLWKATKAACSCCGRRPRKSTTTSIPKPNPANCSIMTRAPRT